MTLLPARKAPQAWADLYLQVEYYADHQPELGRRFMQEVEANLELLSKNPLLGTSYVSVTGRVSDLRYWTMAAFPNHVIFYRLESDFLTVVRVLHSSRDLQSVFESE